MTKGEHLVKRLVLLFGLAAGCGRASEPGPTGSPTYATPGGATATIDATPAELVDRVAAGEARLRALGVLEGVSLIVSPAALQTSCSGRPCALDETDPMIVEYRRQLPRLSRLTDRMAATTVTVALPAAPAGDLAADLAALRRLEIVEALSLVTTRPAANPRCYNLPCPEDVALSTAENQRRADVVHAVAAEVSAAPF